LFALKFKSPVDELFRGEQVYGGGIVSEGLDGLARWSREAGRPGWFALVRLPGMRGSSRALQISGKAVQLLPVAKRWPLPGVFLWIDAQLVSFISGQFQPRWRDRLWDVGRTPKSPQE